MTEDPTHSESAKSGSGSGDRVPIEQAIRAFQTGTDLEDSFDFLFRHFSPRLVRQFIRWGAAAEEARDLNQETFQRIYQDAESFRGGDRLFESWVGWLWKIARTRWLRNLRYQQAEKRPRNPQPLEGIDKEREPRIARPPRQLDRVLDQEVELRVRQAIEELPEQELKCVILYYYQELKTRQISVILKIAQGTVKAHLHHARSKLRTRLGADLELDMKPEEQRVS